ncbi:hypothetical protein EON64_15560, partial [archaeon]
MACLGLTMVSIFLPLNTLREYDLTWVSMWAKDRLVFRRALFRIGPLNQAFSLYLNDAMQQIWSIGYELTCTLLLVYYSPEILTSLRLPLL